MPIFTINKDTEQAIDVRFSERYSEKLARHLAKYSISLEPGTETVGEKPVDLCVLVIAAKQSNTSKTFNFCKLTATKFGEFKLKKVFLKSDKNIPAPLLFIYRKNKKKLPVADELFKLLENYYRQLVEVHKTNFNTLSDFSQNKIKLNELYETEIKILGNKLLLEISKKGFDIDVKGVLLDEFFVNTKPEGICLKRNFDSPALRFNEKISEKISEVSENPQLECSHYDKVPNSPYIDYFASELKDKAKILISDYEKHLHRSEYKEHLQLFFGQKCISHKAKLDVLKKILSTLKEKPEAFIDYLNEIDKSRVLDAHRDGAIIRKIGYFFGADNETKGRKLINNLLTLVKNDRFEARLRFEQ